MAKSTRQQADEHRKQILSAAASLFRERGVSAVSIQEIMAAVGMTHGAFYKHFSSKEQLATMACSAAFEQVIPVREQWVDGKTGRRTIESFMRCYLSTYHRDIPGSGCPTVALATDAARAPQGSTLRDQYLIGTREVITEIASLLEGPEDECFKKATGIYAAMVGAISISRATNGHELSEDVLTAVQDLLTTSPHQVV